MLTSSRFSIVCGSQTYILASAHSSKSISHFTQMTFDHFRWNSYCWSSDKMRNMCNYLVVASLVVRTLWGRQLLHYLCLSEVEELSREKGNMKEQAVKKSIKIYLRKIWPTSEIFLHSPLIKTPPPTSLKESEERFLNWGYFFND